MLVKNTVNILNILDPNLNLLTTTYILPILFSTLERRSLY